MDLLIIFGGKEGVIHLSTSNIIIEDFKEHICKKLNIDSLDYKLKVDFLKMRVELVGISQNKKSILESKNLKKVVVGINNLGYIYAYMYKSYLIQNHKHQNFANITQPKKGWIKKDNNFEGQLYIEPSLYKDNHIPIYESKSTEWSYLIGLIDDWST